MNRNAAGRAGRTHRTPSREWRWQEWVSQPLTPESIATDGPQPAVGDSPSHDAIEELAYALWELRGRPWGDPESDWYRAEQQLLRELSLSAPPKLFSYNV